MTTKPFRLATLLKLRNTVRDQLRWQLADAQRQHSALTTHVTQLAREIDTVRRTSAAMMRAGQVNVDKLRDAQRYESLLLQEQQQIVHQREQLEMEVTRRRESLVEADRDVRVLEKLHARQIERDREHEARDSQKLLDELAVRPFQRKERRQ